MMASSLKSSLYHAINIIRIHSEIASIYADIAEQVL